MGLKSICKYLNEHHIWTRDSGRWGIGSLHQVLTRTTYIGRHYFNTTAWKTTRPKPESEWVAATVPPIIPEEEFYAVQAHLRARSPALTAPRIVAGPTLLTGICFCAACQGAMTLRTSSKGE